MFKDYYIYTHTLFIYGYDAVFLFAESLVSCNFLLYKHKFVLIYEYSTTS